MKRFFTLLVVSFLFIGTGSCTSGRYGNFGPDATFANDAGISIRLVWIKLKGHAVDARLIVSNQSKEVFVYDPTELRFATEKQVAIRRQNTLIGRLHPGTMEDSVLIYGFDPSVSPTEKLLLSFPKGYFENSAGKRSGISTPIILGIEDNKFEVKLRRL